MQSDIRRFLSPQQNERDQDVAGEMDRPAQPTIRRRRIVESDDDAQILQPQNGNAANEDYNVRQEPPPAAMLPVFVLETTSEESAGDIRVSPRMHPIAQALQPHARQLQPHLHRSMAANDRQHRPASRAGAAIQRGMQHQPQRRQRPQCRRFEEEAEESSVVVTTVHTTDSSDCSESDSDAVELYRSAIRGVRNARNARNQQRRRTEHCSVCAKFAAYLEHFI